MRIFFQSPSLVPDYATLAAELDATAETLRLAGDGAAADRLHTHARRLRWGSAVPEDEPVLPRWH